MKSKIIAGVRLLLGLIFFVFGLNGFFNFIPVPEMAPPAGQFMGSLMQTGYMLPLIKITEIVGGALLLANRMVPLGVILLAPVVVNILAFHIFLDMNGLPMAIFLTLAEMMLGKAYWNSFKSLFELKATSTC